MATGKSTWKRNKLLTARRNYFSVGGGMNPIPINQTPYIPDDWLTQLEEQKLGVVINNTKAPGDTIQALNSGIQQGVIPYKTPNNKTSAGNVTKDNNSDWLAGGIAGGVGFLANGITNMVNNISAGDVKANKEALLTSTNNAQMKGQAANDSWDALANDMSMVAALTKKDKYDLGAKKAGAIATEGLTETLKGGLSGYMTGKAIEGMSNTAAYGGPLFYKDRNKYMGGGLLGLITGGVAGLGMSLTGNLIRNHKAAKAAEEVNKQIAYTNDFNERSLANRAENLGMAQLAGLEANYSAFGGPIGDWDGAIGYQFMQDYLNSKRLQAEGQDDKTQALPTTSSMNVLRAFGGNLGVHGGDFTNGLTFIDEGGSHESNPYEGVPMGVDQEGTPNLVEEGETIYNDYVFSRRLKVPKAIRNKYKMRGTKDLSFAEASKKMAKESEERPNDPISQRGLDALMSDLAMAQEGIKAKRQQREGMYALGGRVNKFDGLVGPSKLNRNHSQSGITFDESPDYNIYNSDKTINYDLLYNDNSPYKKRWDWLINNWDAAYNSGYLDKYAEGINTYNKGRKGYTPITGKDLYGNKDQTVRLAFDGKEEGGGWGGYHAGIISAGNPETFSIATNPPADPTIPPADRNAQTRHWLMQKDAAGTPLDPVLIDDYDASKYTYLNTKNTSDDTTDYTDHYYNLKPEVTTEEKEKDILGDELREKLKQGKYADWLRYAPGVGFGIGVLTDAAGITNKPDFSNANMVLESTRGSITPQVGFKPIGNYLAEQDMDREFYINQLNATAGANRRALLQNAGLNRGAGMAAILAADNNAQNQLGLFARQAEEYNRDDRHKVADFNRATNMFNSEGFLKADMANQAAAQSGRDFNLRGTIAAAEMRANEKARADANKSANISGLFQTLGDIGFEEKNARMRDWAILHGVFGPGTWDYGRIKKASKGGKLKRKGYTI